MAAVDRFTHPSKRYRLFFDETGNGDLNAAKKDPNQRYLSLTGIVIRQDIHDRYTTRRLTRLKGDIFGYSHKSIVLHRREIVARKGAFAALNDDHLRAQFDARFAALLAEVPAPAFTVSIDKQAHLDKYKVWQFSPYHYVMTCLLERFVPRPRRFYAKVTLDPNRPTPQVSNIAQSILSELDRARGTTITLVLDIAAETGDGFSKDVENIVRDNAASLRITDFGFEEE
jgi:hypothetical protein